MYSLHATVAEFIALAEKVETRTLAKATALSVVRGDPAFVKLVDEGVDETRLLQLCYTFMAWARALVFMMPDIRRDIRRLNKGQSPGSAGRPWRIVKRANGVGLPWTPSAPPMPNGRPRDPLSVFQLATHQLVRERPDGRCLHTEFWQLAQCVLGTHIEFKSYLRTWKRARRELRRQAPRRAA